MNNGIVGCCMVGSLPACYARAASGHGCRATEQSDERAAPQLIELHLLP
jgi:hypothetical protein